MTMPTDLPVAVIGAGPVGLAAAAHLALRKMPFVVLERGLQSAAVVRYWAHVTVFSPWRFNIDTAARELLQTSGWSFPDAKLDSDPTGRELIDNYLEPLAELQSISPFIRYARDLSCLCSSRRICLLSNSPFRTAQSRAAG